MKKSKAHVILALAASICITGCGLAGQPQQSIQPQAEADTKTGSDNFQKQPQQSIQPQRSVQPQAAAQATSIQEVSNTQTGSNFELPRMVMVEDKLYVDTGETNNSSGRCGVMDGKITSSVKANKEPKKNGQSNFGKGYGFQYGFRKGRIEVFIKDSWHIFAYNENNLDGVSMEVVKSTPSRAVLNITNTTDLQIEFGEDYILEKLDKKTGEWSQIPVKAEDYGFDSIAYTVPKNKPVTHKVNWRIFYGKQKPGTYRIVKPFHDFRDTRDYTTYTFMTEFKIKR